MSTRLVSPDSILRKLYLHPCLNVRQLALLHNVDASNEALNAAVADLTGSAWNNYAGARR